MLFPRLATDHVGFRNILGALLPLKHINFPVQTNSPLLSVNNRTSWLFLSIVTSIIYCLMCSHPEYNEMFTIEP